MNFKKFINLDYLKSNPLCGINNYNDELNLNTGACIRRIKKLELTGDENITLYNLATGKLFRIDLPTIRIQGQFALYGICSHYRPVILASDRVDGTISGGDASRVQGVVDIVDNYATVADFKAYLSQQSAAGTPVTVWYAVSTQTTETITVPTGLIGTVDGYLNQSGTPTPTNPIYPSANTVEQWFNLNQYIMSNAEWQNASVKQWDGSQWD